MSALTTLPRETPEGSATHMIDSLRYESPRSRSRLKQKQANTSFTLTRGNDVANTCPEPNTRFITANGRSPGHRFLLILRFLSLIGYAVVPI